MLYNDTSGGQGLVQDAEDLTGLGDGAISGNSTLLKTFTRYMNQWYLKAIAWLLESNPYWKWDDSNYTDFPEGTTDLVADQKDYELPVAASGDNASTFLKLQELTVLDASGNESPLVHTTEKESVLNEQYPTSGLPKFYKLVNKSVKVWPSPNASNTTLTDGFKVYYQRTPDLFKTTDTTQEPGIPSLYHRILSMGASYDYSIIHNPDIASALRGELSVKEQGIKSFHAQANQDDRINIVPRAARENYN